MNGRTALMRSPVDVLDDRPAVPDSFGISGQEGAAGVVRRAVRIGLSGLLFAENETGELLDVVPTLHGVPNTPVWFCGVVNIRGNIVPVFDLGLLLNHQSSVTAKARIFIHGKGDAMAAFYMDALPQRMQLEAQQRLAQSPLETELDQYIQAAYMKDDVIWLDMDMEGMFGGLADRM